MNLEDTVKEIAASAKKAAAVMAGCSTGKKNEALLAIAQMLEENKARIMEENEKDLARGRENGLSPAMLDRLAITEATIASMAGGLRFVAGLEDPVGEVSDFRKRPNGLEVARMRVPLGVVGIIYESRPNVTVDAAGLCLKAGNAVILRGGSEALHSNRALAGVICEALEKCGLPPEAACVIPVRDREAVNVLLKQEEYVDLIIPRGGEGLIRFVTANSTIPVLKHYKGVCHLYVDEGADLKKAEEICFNAKTHRPGVCNAMETLLVSEKEAAEFLPAMAERYMASGVTLKGCDACRAIVPEMQPATVDDWHAEYLDLVLAVKVVADMDEAMAHIAVYGSNHTEGIITRDYERSRRFVREVDASLVIVNASTRFNDGGELGLGAEMGISTSKLHAYGPMGIRELTTSKFIAYGDGQVRI